MEAFKYKVEVRDAAPRVALERKWGVAGQTGRRDDAIHVEVYHRSDAEEHVIAAAFGHECGHGDQFAENADLAPQALSGPEHFDIEVEAWERWQDQRGEGITRSEGELILDCLTTYRRGLANITDEMWDEARQRVESWVQPEGALEDYVPDEPEENDVPLCSAGRMVVIAAPQDDADDEDDAPTPETEDDEQDAPSDDDEEDEDTYEDEDDEEDDEPIDSGSAGKDDAPLEDDDEKDDEPELDAAELLRDRDAWLASTEGQQATVFGRNHLVDELTRRGWTSVALPPLTQALLVAER